MKAILTIMTVVFLSTTAFSKPIQETIPVQLGPKAFRDGDVIQIEEVRSTSPNFEQGDTVTVKGHYRLDSKAAASLQLLVTQIQSDGLEETDAGQTITASRGLKPFEVTITVKHKGYLHLTFYDAESGKPFGGTYFGSKTQMNQATNLSVLHYLK